MTPATPLAVASSTVPSSALGPTSLALPAADLSALHGGAPAATAAPSPAATTGGGTGGGTGAGSGPTTGVHTPLHVPSWVAHPTVLTYVSGGFLAAAVVGAGVTWLVRSDGGNRKLQRDADIRRLNARRWARPRNVKPLVVKKPPLPPAAPAAHPDADHQAEQTLPAAGTSGVVPGVVPASAASVTPPVKVPQVDPLAGRVPLGRLQGRLLYSGRLESVIVVAPTRSGKTAAVVVPTLVDWCGPAVVTSVKGEVLELTAAARLARGPVYVFAPGYGDLGVPGVVAARFDPLAQAMTWDGSVAAVQFLQACAASSKAGRFGGGSGGDDSYNHWEQLALQLLAPMVLLAAVHGRGIAQVLQWVQSRTEEELTAAIEDLDEPEATRSWTASLATDPRTKSSVYGTAQVLLSPFFGTAAAAAVAVDPPSAQAGPDGEPAPGTLPGTLMTGSRLLEERATLFVIAPVSDQARYAPLFESVINSVVRAQYERAARLKAAAIVPGRDLLLLLEEAANVAALKELPEIASAGAGQGVKLVTIWQDEAQIAGIYGPTGAANIISNHVNAMYLGGQTNLDTLARLSEWIGDHTYVDRSGYSVDHQGRRVRQNQQVTERIAPVSWLSARPRGEALVKSASFAPMLTRLTPYYEDKRLRALMDPQVLARYSQAYSKTPARTGSRKPAGSRKAR